MRELYGSTAKIASREPWNWQQHPWAADKYFLHLQYLKSPRQIEHARQFIRYNEFCQLVLSRLGRNVFAPETVLQQHRSRYGAYADADTIRLGIMKYPAIPVKHDARSLSSLFRVSWQQHLRAADILLPVSSASSLPRTTKRSWAKHSWLWSPPERSRPQTWSSMSAFTHTHRNRPSGYANANTIRLGLWNGLMCQRDTAEMLHANLERKNCMVTPPSKLSRTKWQQHPRAANILSSSSRLNTDLSFNHTQWATSSAQYPRKIKHARHSRDVEKHLSTRTPNNQHICANANAIRLRPMKQPGVPTRYDASFDSVHICSVPISTGID
jgi:hypothetical protein